MPPTELPQPVATTTAPVVLPQPSRRLAACEAPADLNGCTPMARLRVGRIELSSSTCYVDVKVHGGDQGQLMRCPSGAVAVFSRASFAGAWGNDGVDACLRTEFPFRDGCTWETMQRMRGGPSVLEFTYAERPIRGDSCTPSACTARADVEVYEP